MNTVVSFAEARQKRRAEAVATAHGENIAEQIRRQLLEYGSDRREDLWYLSRLAVHGIYAIGRLVQELQFAPKLYHRVTSHSVRTNASNKSIWSCSMGDRKGKRYEVFRFCIKVVPNEPHAPKGYSANTNEWYYDKLDEVYPDGMVLADVMLHTAYRAALLSLFIAKGAVDRTIEPMDEDHCFHASGLRHVGDFLVCEAHRILPDDQRLVVTGFYNTRVVQWILEKDKT